MKWMILVLCLMISTSSFANSVNNDKKMTETSSLILKLHNSIPAFKVCAEALGFFSTSAFFHGVINCASDFNTECPVGKKVEKTKSKIIKNLKLINNSPEYKHCVDSLGHYNTDASYNQAIQCSLDF